MYGIIATWRMALEGITKADEMLKNHGDAGDAIVEAVKAVEDFPYYKSVGYGGLPNEEMIVELDAAYMNGNTLSVEELFAAFSRREMKKDLKAESAFLQNTPVLLEKMACAERFRKCTVGGFVNEILSSQAQQFAAVTIGLDDGTTYISFRGTDDTIVGWKEDFNLSNGVVPSQDRKSVV